MNMNYIVLDMEWNQPLSYDSHVYQTIGDKLLFEIIQIGAVKLSDTREVLDSISVLIKPSHYVKVHPRISRLTGINKDLLEGAPGFCEAMSQFRAWCGDNCVFLTWGCDDISVLKQNMDFFSCEESIPPFYDSMIGKLIVQARTREECIRKMHAALCELVLEGVTHTGELQTQLLQENKFVDGSYTTKFLDTVV